MKIATFNINSIGARIELFSNWLKETNPDVVLLQEIKTEYNSFPFFEIQALGYEAKVLGQKSYNGVAVLSRHKIKTISEGIPGFDDENSRYLETEVEFDKQTYRIASIYLPNGNPPANQPDDKTKLDYKLRWMEAFYRHLQKLLLLHQPVIIGGDFNVILTPDDVYNPEAFRNNALFLPEVRRRLNSILHLGYYDAFRTLHPRENGYTYWDYGGGAFQNDWGMRIDYFLLSPQATDCLLACEVDKSIRGQNKPSDHTPLVIELKRSAHEEN